MRKQIALLAAAFGVGNVMAVAAFTMLKKNNDFSVVARVTGSGAGALPIEVCDDAGKIRVFKDIDDFVKVCSKAGLINSASNVSMQLENPVAFEPPLFTGDIVKKNRALVTAYGLTVTKLTATETALTSAVALSPSATPQEVAYKAELQAQLTAVTDNKAFLAAEIVRINALLPPVAPI